MIRKIFILKLRAVVYHRCRRGSRMAFGGSRLSPQFGINPVRSVNMLHGEAVVPIWRLPVHYRESVAIGTPRSLFWAFHDNYTEWKRIRFRAETRSPCRSPFNAFGFSFSSPQVTGPLAYAYAHWNLTSVGYRRQRRLLFHKMHMSCLGRSYGNGASVEL